MIDFDAIKAVVLVQLKTLKVFIMALLRHCHVEPSNWHTDVELVDRAGLLMVVELQRRFEKLSCLEGQLVLPSFAFLDFSARAGCEEVSRKHCVGDGRLLLLGWAPNDKNN